MMKRLLKQQVSTGTKVLVGSAILTFALGSAYLMYRKKQPDRKAENLHPDHNENLNMERYVLSIPTDQGPIEAVVEAGGECYAVHLDGRYAGSMWRDEEQDVAWHTKDSELEPYFGDIAAQLSEAFSRQGFPSILKGTYPEILQTNWKGGETLEVILNADTDLEVFGTFLKDEVLNLVTFEEHLDLLVKKQDAEYFVLVGIN